MNRFAFVFLVACVSLCANALCQQTSTGASSGVSGASRGSASASDPDAVALLQRVLSNLGGAGAWRSVGAATTNVTWTMPDGTQKQIHRADDWSGTSVLSRRDSVGSHGGTQTAIMTGQFLSHPQPDGTQKIFPKDPDLVLLAERYPGAAILRSLQLPNCTVSMKLTLTGRWPRLPLTVSQDETIVYEQCIEPLFPDGRCDIAWIVSPDSATLRGVWLPVRGQMNGLITYDQVRYDKFQSIGNLSVPSNITVIRQNGSVDTFIVDPPAFSSQMPSSIFNHKK